MAKKQNDEYFSDDPNQEQLPGTGPTLEQFVEDVRAYEVAKTARMEMLETEKAAKKVRDAGARYHRKEFVQDEDNDHILVFKKGGVRVEITKTESEEIKSKLDDQPEGDD